MPNDQRRCPAKDCGQQTAYFDPVARVWRCPCGWRDKR